MITIIKHFNEVERSDNFFFDVEEIRTDTRVPASPYKSGGPGPGPVQPNVPVWKDDLEDP